MRTDRAIKLVEKWSYDYIKMDCAHDKCYGVLAVHRICFALCLFHTILSAFLVGVKDTRTKRAALQNGWWGPKVLLWLVLVAVSFAIPNPFFIFWGNYVSLIGATLFIILGLVLLVDFAHSWSETCLDHIDQDPDNRLWPLILVGSTAGLYLASIVLTVLLYIFFAGSGCTLNQFLISFNLALCVLITLICVHPAVQDANPRSGLAQASMVAAYCTYLITSAVGNHTDGQCNPLHRSPARNGTVIMGAIFTFLAIAYSTSRAATQSRALVGKKRAAGAIALPDTEDHVRGDSGVGLVTTQPTRKDTPRYQALLSAVEAGAIPASALDEDDEDEDSGPTGDERDDERTGTRYNYSWFHIIFVMGSMYVGMLLTDWNVVSTRPLPNTDSPDPNQDIYIGRSETAMWMRIVSSWVCIVLYIWSLVAPVFLPDRFGDL